MSNSSIGGVGVFKIRRDVTYGKYRPVFQKLNTPGSTSAAYRWMKNEGQRFTLESTEHLDALDHKFDDVLDLWTSAIGTFVNFVDADGDSLGLLFVHNVQQVYSAVLGPNTGVTTVAMTRHLWDVESF